MASNSSMSLKLCPLAYAHRCQIRKVDPSHSSAGNPVVSSKSLPLLCERVGKHDFGVIHELCDGVVSDCVRVPHEQE